MRIVLTKNVPSLGSAGEVKEVKSGFAWNWLIPQDLARPAQKADALNYKKTLALKEQKLEETKEKEKALAEKLKDLVLEIPINVSEKGKAYGSLDVGVIASALKEKGVEIDKENIKLTYPIKKIGEYKVLLKLSTQTTNPSIKVKVISQ